MWVAVMMIHGHLSEPPRVVVHEEQTPKSEESFIKSELMSTLINIQITTEKLKIYENARQHHSHKDYNPSITEAKL